MKEETSVTYQPEAKDPFSGIDDVLAGRATESMWILCNAFSLLGVGYVNAVSYGSMNSFLDMLRQRINTTKEL